MTTIDAALRAVEIQGSTVPKLGFGTWQIEGPACQEAVEDALAIGYRHIDTARAYGNERDVGRGLEASGVSRRELFLTTKIWRDEYAPDDLRARPRTLFRTSTSAAWTCCSCTGRTPTSPSRRHSERSWGCATR